MAGRFGKVSGILPAGFNMRYYSTGMPPPITGMYGCAAGMRRINTTEYNIGAGTPRTGANILHGYTGNYYSGAAMLYTVFLLRSACPNRTQLPARRYIHTSKDPYILPFLTVTHLSQDGTGHNYIFIYYLS